MINKRKEIEYFKDISLKRLREKVKEIIDCLPEEKQNVITYSRNFTLSLSNYCINNCGYCYYNFRVPKYGANKNVILLSKDKVKNQVDEAITHDCKEGLVMSGEKPDEFPEVRKELKKQGFNNYIDYVQNICRYLLQFKILPHTNIGFLTFKQIKLLKMYNASMGLMLESTSKKLFQKGGVHEYSPGKKPKRRINSILNAGKLKIPFTTGLLLGIGESFEDRVNDLYVIKEIYDKYHHIQEVILQNFEYKKGISYNPAKPISMKDMVKITGIAKLIFKNDIPLQVPPNLIKGYERSFIEMGINDFGGISPFTQDYINPEKEWPKIEYLREFLEKKGYILQERLPIYEKYVNNKSFCPEKIKNIINYYFNS
jgi:FO synthase subunit 1